MAEKRALLWAEWRNDRSYLSYLVKDIVGLLELKLMDSLLGLRFEDRTTSSEIVHTNDSRAILMYIHQRRDGQVINVWERHRHLDISWAHAGTIRWIPTNSTISQVRRVNNGILYCFIREQFKQEDVIEVHHFDFEQLTNQRIHTLPIVQKMSYLLALSETGVLYQSENGLYYQPFVGLGSPVGFPAHLNRHSNFLPGTDRQINDTYLFYLSHGTLYGWKYSSPLTAEDLSWIIPKVFSYFLTDEVLLIFTETEIKAFSFDLLTPKVLWTRPPHSYISPNVRTYLYLQDDQPYLITENASRYRFFV